VVRGVALVFADELQVPCPLFERVPSGSRFAEVLADSLDLGDEEEVESVPVGSSSKGSRMRDRERRPLAVYVDDDDEELPGLAARPSPAWARSTASRNLPRPLSSVSLCDGFCPSG